MAKSIVIYDLNDLMPDGENRAYTYDTDEDTGQVNLSFPTRASVYEFIQDACNNISKEIEAYKPGAPQDDSTYDIQNALEELVKVEKLGSLGNWD